MKRKNISAICSIAVIMAIALMVGCSKKDETPTPTLNVSVSVLSFPSDGAAQTLSITTSGAWTISGAPSWADVSATSGTGDAEITVAANANTATTERNAELIINVSGATSVKVALSQAAAGSTPTPTPTLSVSPPSLNFVSGGEPKTFAITTSGSWTLSGKPSWAEVSSTSGTGNTTITVTANPNSATTARNAELTITASGVTAKVALSQAAAGSTFVPVTNITSVPTTATVGTPLALTGTVAPSNATNKTITWSVSGPATIAGSTLTATAAGTVVVTATIVNGASATTNYTQDFNITASAASGSSFVPVTNITGVPTTANVGTPLALTGTVAPSNATNKTITWSVKSGPANLSGGASLTTTAAGTIVVTATIVNGASATTNYTKDFNITASYPFTPTPTLSVSENLLSFASGGEEKTVTVTTTAGTNWTTGSMPSGFSVSPTTGTGTTTVRITATPNSFAVVRMGTITFSAPGATPVNVTVTQAANITPFTVSPTSLSFTSSQGSKTVSVKVPSSTTEWSWLNTNSWISVSPPEGNRKGDQTLMITVQRNTTIFSRTGTISFTSGSTKINLTVTQDRQTTPILP